MRSDLIFRAQEKVANRYRLCHAASKVSRCLHYYSTTTQDAISDAFVRIAYVPCLAQPRSAASSAEAHQFVDDIDDIPSLGPASIWPS